jgi:predicted dehydrogenase
VEATPVGLIGCGRVAGLRHLPALAQLPDARVVAVADEHPGRLAETAERFGVERRYAGHAELLADPEIEAVAVLVPASRHAEVATAALEAGKHVLLEKPVSLDLDEADELVELVANSSGRLFVAFNLRWHRLVREARRLIAAGAIGRPEVLSSAFTSRFDYRQEAKAWRLGRETGGGVLVEIAPHHFDLWNFLLGDQLTEVSAFTRDAELEDEGATVQARTRSGTLLTGVFSQRTLDTNEVDLRGDEGRLRLNLYAFDGVQLIPRPARVGDLRERLGSFRGFVRHLPGAVSSARTGGLYVGSYLDEWRHFLAVCRGEAEPGCTIEEGREALRITLAAAEAASTGRTVGLDEAPSTLASVRAAL